LVGARAKEAYGTCLLTEGNAAGAISLLQAAIREFAEAKVNPSSADQARGLLGEAYDKVGRTKEARSLLKAAVDKYSLTLKAGDPRLLKQREVWGSFLLEHGESQEAEQQFWEILKQSTDGMPSYVALSYGRLAQLAIKRNDLSAALDFSERAVNDFEHVTGFRDVRMGPQLWRIRAEALLRSDDAKGAEEWAQRALDADRQYDDPASADIADAERTLAAAKTSRGT
jgi:tetratricopeptide (TPR) repeat protein